MGVITETERLILRRYREEDLQDLYEYLSNPKVVEYEPYKPMSMEEVKDNLAWRISTEEMIAVELKFNHKMIGNVYLGKRDFDSLEIGYVFNDTYWGKGYAKESCEAMIQWAFANGAHRIYAECDPKNKSSWGLLEKLGFEREGYLKENVYFWKDEQGNPIWKDTYIYAKRNKYTKRFRVTITESLLATTQNTRELGGYVIRDGVATRRNSLWRSDVQNYPSKEDFACLKERGITTIIDLRGEKDIVRKPSGFADVSGFTYVNCPIVEGSGVPESVEAVPVSYLAIAQAENMPKVFQTIAASEAGVMFNCTAGKDRTGVVSAILLLHAGVSDADIIENYVLTREYGKERLALVHKNFPEVDMNIVTPKEWFMEEFLRLFRAKFGTTDNYFTELGLSTCEIEAIRQKLV